MSRYGFLICKLHDARWCSQATAAPKKEWIRVETICICNRIHIRSRPRNFSFYCKSDRSSRKIIETCRRFNGSRCHCRCWEVIGNIKSHKNMSNKAFSSSHNASNWKPYISCESLPLPLPRHPLHFQYRYLIPNMFQQNEIPVFIILCEPPSLIKLQFGFAQPNTGNCHHTGMFIQ